MIRKRIIFASILLSFLFHHSAVNYSNKVLAASNYDYTVLPQNTNQNYNSINSYNNTNNINNANNTYAETVRTVKRPEWYEFAPLDYENPKKYKIPFTNPQFDSNYWYERKQDFENYLSQCDSRAGEYKNLCYEKLRAREIQLSNSWEPMSVRAGRVSAQYRQHLREQQILDAMTRPIQVNHTGTFYHNIRY